jgi:hypothetical protein
MKSYGTNYIREVPCVSHGIEMFLRDKRKPFKLVDKPKKSQSDRDQMEQMETIPEVPTTLRQLQEKTNDEVRTHLLNKVDEIMKQLNELKLYLS